jgi:ParB-like chromosome segregation protein Spo0J
MSATPLVIMSKYAFHPIANMFPLLEGGEFAALVADIRVHGLHEPIELFENMILDGRNRDRTCHEAGVEPQYREVTFGSYAEAIAYVVSKNIHRRHLTAEQRRGLIEKLLKAAAENSDRLIASTANVDHKTVGTVRRQAEATGEIPQLQKRTGKDSKQRKRRARKTIKPGSEVTPTGGGPSPESQDSAEASAGRMKAAQAAARIKKA